MLKLNNFDSCNKEKKKNKKKKTKTKKSSQTIHHIFKKLTTNLLTPDIVSSLTHFVEIF